MGFCLSCSLRMLAFHSARYSFLSSFPYLLMIYSINPIQSTHLAIMPQSIVLFLTFFATQASTVTAILMLPMYRWTLILRTSAPGVHLIPLISVPFETSPLYFPLRRPFTFYFPFDLTGLRFAGFISASFYTSQAARKFWFSILRQIYFSLQSHLLLLYEVPNTLRAWLLQSRMAWGLVHFYFPIWWGSTQGYSTDQ